MVLMDCRLFGGAVLGFGAGILASARAMSGPGVTRMGVNLLRVRGDGVVVEGYSAGIGGQATAASPLALGSAGGNLISGNGRHGVSYVDTTAHSAYMGTISGNFIGTDVTGTKALGNGGSGLYLSTLWTSAGNCRKGRPTIGQRRLSSVGRAPDL